MLSITIIFYNPFRSIFKEYIYDNIKFIIAIEKPLTIS
jgi:hypothetical protein